LIQTADVHKTQSAHIPGAQPAPAEFLGGAWLRAAAALRSGSGCGHDGAGDVPAGAGAAALQGGLRTAFTKAGGWALRRESQSPLQAYPTAGDPQAPAGQRAGAVFGVADGDWHSPAP